MLINAYLYGKRFVVLIIDVSVLFNSISDGGELGGKNYPYPLEKKLNSERYWQAEDLPQFFS